jgi:hypothetical protein
MATSFHNLYQFITHSHFVVLVTQLAVVKGLLIHGKSFFPSCLPYYIGHKFLQTQYLLFTYFTIFNSTSSEIFVFAVNVLEFFRPYICVSFCKQYFLLLLFYYFYTGN